MTTLDITPAMRAAAEAEARKLNPGRSEEHIKSVALDGLSIYRAMRAAEPAALVQMGALDPLTLSRIRGLVDEAIYTHIFDADAGEQPGPDDPYVKAVNDLDAMIAGTSPGVAWERRGASIYTEDDGTPGKAVCIADLHPKPADTVQRIVDAHNEHVAGKSLGKLAVVVDGGMVTDVIADGALVGLPVTIIDYDTDQADPENDCVEIAQDDGDTERAFILHASVVQATITIPDDSALAPTDRWTPAMTAQATVEGWDLFQCNGYMEIERDDAEGVFTTDDDAVTHVAKRAGEGSEMHQLALVIHNDGLYDKAALDHGDIAPVSGREYCAANGITVTEVDPAPPVPTETGLDWRWDEPAQEYRLNDTGEGFDALVKPEAIADLDSATMFAIAASHEENPKEARTLGRAARLYAGIVHRDGPVEALHKVFIMATMGKVPMAQSELRCAIGALESSKGDRPAQADKRALAAKLGEYVA